MNWTIIIIETAILVLIFTAAIMIPPIKNPVWWIHDYPKDIQDRYFETHERVPTRFFSLHRDMGVSQVVGEKPFPQSNKIEVS